MLCHLSAAPLMRGGLRHLASMQAAMQGMRALGWVGRRWGVVGTGWLERMVNATSGAALRDSQGKCVTASAMPAPGSLACCLPCCAVPFLLCPNALTALVTFTTRLFAAGRRAGGWRLTRGGSTSKSSSAACGRTSGCRCARVQVLRCAAGRRRCALGCARRPRLCRCCSPAPSIPCCARLCATDSHPLLPSGRPPSLPPYPCRRSAGCCRRGASRRRLCCP